MKLTNQFNSTYSNLAMNFIIIDVSSISIDRLDYIKYSIRVKYIRNAAELILRIASNSEFSLLLLDKD